MDLISHISSSGKITSAYWSSLMRMDFLMIDEV